TITIKTKGIDEKGDVVCEFSFQWSIKARSKP
ncbi:MAG: thioesterase, partial [Flavobacteriaceae bacterium]|nr:thioesterase [Flavobacteriaceae bacterium]